MQDQSVPRRRFLIQTTAGAALAVASIAGADEMPISRAVTAEGELESVETETDVLVVGGGTAGVIAAIQAARAGARTTLLEQSSLLGGTTTVGGVPFPGLFHAWGEQIIAGIGWELVRQTVELDGGRLPDFTTPPSRHWEHQVLVNPYLYAILAEEACREAGVRICYYESPSSVQQQGENWQVNVTGPGLNRLVTCRQLIDCTGGADIVGMLGFERLRENETQPGSMLFKMSGSSFSPGRERLDAVYVHGADSSNSATRTQANLTGRRAILEQLRAKREQGDSEARLVQLQSETAFRESYRILGEVVISHEDYTSGRMFEDAICNAFYPVDLHTRTGVRPVQLEPGTVPKIPLRALIPHGSRNILVAGRSVSSDRLANSGLRVQATCMAMGQAAGAAAALAVQNGDSPGNVAIEELRSLLRTHGAVVPSPDEA